MKTIELNGLTFKVEHIADDCGDAPWDREDGHGPVSGWRKHGDDSRGAYKRAGERELCDDGRSYGQTRFYDMREALKIAKRDGWGLGDDELMDLARRLKRDPKPGDIAAESVERDFQRLRAWCADQWGYIGVVVTLLDVDGEETDENESLWGIESDAGDYLDEVANELAGEISRRVGNKTTLPGQRIRETDENAV